MTHRQAKSRSRPHLGSVRVSGGMSLCGWEGRVFAVCSAPPPLRHGRKGGGDKPCQDVPAGAAWHDVAEDGLRTVAEWRSDKLAGVKVAGERRQTHLPLARKPQ